MSNEEIRVGIAGQCDANTPESHRTAPASLLRTCQNSLAPFVLQVIILQPVFCWQKWALNSDFRKFAPFIIRAAPLLHYTRLWMSAHSSWKCQRVTHFTDTQTASSTHSPLLCSSAVSCLSKLSRSSRSLQSSIFNSFFSCCICFSWTLALSTATFSRP